MENPDTITNGNDIACAIELEQVEKDERGDDDRGRDGGLRRSADRGR